MIFFLLLIVALVWFLRHQDLALNPVPSPSVTISTTIGEPASKVILPAPIMTSVPVAQKTIPSDDRKDRQVSFVIKEGFAVAFGDTLLGKPAVPMEEGAVGIHEPEMMRLWPQSALSYYIRPEVKHPEVIRQALEHLEKNSPLRFGPVQVQNEDSLVFEPGQELCASYMGRVGGPQPILVAERCTWNEIVHEILHALGFPHEQSRADRDRYVEILSNNIDPRFLMQFERVTTPVLEVLEQTGFDYNSIMLYSATAYAKTPGLETIRSREPGRLIEPSHEGLSATDKERLFRMFNAR